MAARQTTRTPFLIQREIAPWTNIQRRKLEGEGEWGSMRAQECCIPRGGSSTVTDEPHMQRQEPTWKETLARKTAAGVGDTTFPVQLRQGTCHCPSVDRVQPSFPLLGLKQPALSVIPHTCQASLHLGSLHVLLPHPGKLFSGSAVSLLAHCIQTSAWRRWLSWSSSQRSSYHSLSSHLTLFFLIILISTQNYMCCVRK